MRGVRLWPIALALVLACTAGPEAQGSPAATDQAPAGVAPPTATAPTCDEARQRELLRSFFEGYNARDAQRVLATFRSDGPAALDYYDNVDSDAVQLRDVAALRTYLQRRWALGDRFEVEIEAIALNARFPNPTFSFRRVSDQGMYAGNVKFVCNAGRFVGVVTSSVATSRSECPETAAVAGTPSNANTAAFSRRWYASADRRIWASKPERFYVGGNKVLWERPTGERLTISGRPRGSAGPELSAIIPNGYESLDYQASGIDFPVAGCWEIVGRSGASELRFVTEVYPESYAPPVGRCMDMADAAANARWVLTVQVDSNKPDRPGFVLHQTTVLRSWKGASAPVGHAAAIWQDGLYEPVLERGGTYVLFLGQRTFGSPNVQYGLTRILCPLRTIIEVRGAEIHPPASYDKGQWIWTGSSALSELERVLAKVGP